MEIQSPTRQQAITALKARSAELIRGGDMRGAERMQNDLVVLSKAKGETLYDMHRLALPNTNISYPEESSLKEHFAWCPPFAVFGTVGAAAGAITLGCGVIGGAGAGFTIVGAGLLGAVGGYTLWAKNRMDTRSKARAIVDAVEHNQAYIRGYVPKPDEQLGVQIDRKVFLAALQGQEARLAANGEYTRAGDMRKVHTALARLEGNTVEELFQSLISSQNREALDLVQGKCSGDVAQSIETLAEVSKLVGPQGKTLLREDEDSLVIGGVVLKKRSEAA